MKQIDLELYRWGWHNLTKPKYDVKKYGSSLYYWREYGAFISVTPRQSGKTAMLGIIIKNILRNNKSDKIIVIVPSISMIVNFCKITKYNSNTVYSPSGFMNTTHKINFNDTNLIIDDFYGINKLKLNIIINNMWKSVTMVSSLY